MTGTLRNADVPEDDGNWAVSGQSAFSGDDMLAVGGSDLRAMTACDPISDAAWFSPRLASTVCPSPELS